MVTTFAVPRGNDFGASSSSSRSLSSFAKAHALLRAHGHRSAPTVVARLVAGCHGDPQAFLETVERLTADQRAGQRCLPDPLPLVPAIVEHFSEVSLEEWETRTLLAASVCVDDRIDVLLAIAERPMDALIESPLSSLLMMVAGRFAFADARVRTWVHESASLGERTRLHHALLEIYEVQGDHARALWHRALSSMSGDTSIVPAMLDVAREELESGNAERAYVIAREAASHADETCVDAARSFAGRAALNAGWVADALDWLSPVIISGGDAARAMTLPSYIVAATLQAGVVPAADLAQHRPTTADAEQWFSYGRAAGLAAGLCAERGAKSESRTWLAATREADAAAGADGALREPAVGWSSLFLGEPIDELYADERQGLIDNLCRALRLALEGDIAGGLQIVLHDEGSCVDLEDALALGFGRSPYARAHRAVIEALLRLWQGDVTGASRTLKQGAYTLPLALPFAGLGVQLARRLELAIDGHTGPLSESLTAALPTPLPQDRLVDRGLESYLSGRVEEAAVHVRLWAERGAPTAPLGLPGLDEVGPIDPPAVIEPPDVARARAVRLRIRSARENAWMQDYQDAAEESRSIVSPFERGRVEAMLGITCVTRGDRGAGQRHLRAAQSLFTEAGAGAWRAAIDVRLARLGEQLAENLQLPTMPIAVASAEPLATCRAAWEPLLTERELATAMLVAEGRTNREISEQMRVSVRTVEVYIGRLFTKFDVKSRGELTALAHRTNQHA